MEKYTDSLLVLCAGVFLVLYSWDILGQLEGTAHSAAEWSMWVLWLVFLIDYFVRLYLAEDRVR